VSSEGWRVQWEIKPTEAKIGQSDCVLVIAGMHACYSSWIQSEIEAALEMQKPIISVAPKGQDKDTGSDPFREEP
jgi:hypothetical protein